MPSLLKDPFQAKLTIRRSQSKLRKEMKDLVKMRATGSKYGALKRQDKRRAEYHHDRMTEEKSLQEDLRRAETMAKRIAQVLEQLRKDFNKMKNFVGNYNFTNTVGMDSESSGACESDLSTAIDTRAAWKKELKNLIEMAWHYVDAQYLGNYAVLHTVAGTDSNGSCSTVTTTKSCCPLVYRPAFHYITPAGDCLSMPTSAGEASGDSTAVTASNTIDPEQDSESIESEANSITAELDNVVPDAEQGLASPSSRNHNKVSNCNLALRTLYNLVVPETAHEDTWVTFVKAEINAAQTTYEYGNASDDAGRIELLKSYLLNTTCLPSKMVEEIENDLADSTDLTNWQSIDALSSTVLAHIPSVDNVEDESDLPFIIKMLTERMNKVRKCQITNDREQQRIQYVRETSECNQAFHQVEFDRLTGFEESEVQARYAMGVKMSSDLDDLHKEHSVSKQTFFNDITLKGCCW